MKAIFKNDLFNHILHPSFPCIMAKSVVKQGYFETFTLEDLSDKCVEEALSKLHAFIDEMQVKNMRLSSCVVVIENEELKKDFNLFENKFWPFLKQLNSLDKKNWSPDPTVSADPSDAQFSYSLKSESFFIVALHPESPRWARRFSYPAIVFNPHKQFEEMRKNGNFQKVRDLIRVKDKLLQGSVNPMMQNFGEKSEVYQYLGKVYSPQDSVPLNF